MSPKSVLTKRRAATALVGFTVGLFLLLGTLILSGQIPPRGLISGSMRDSTGGPAADQSVIFEGVDGPGIFTTKANSEGYFSVTLPPGHYYVDSAMVCSGFPGCRPVRVPFAVGPQALNIAAGQHLDLRLAIGYVIPHN